MDLMKIPLMSAIKDRMQWLTGNQRLLAQNVANADTPGYRPKRLLRQDFGSLLDLAPERGKAVPVHLARTRPDHLSESGVPAAEAREEAAPIEQSAVDGNAVDLESEMLAMSQNQMEYGLMVELYRKQVGLLRTALRGPGGDNR